MTKDFSAGRERREYPRIPLEIPVILIAAGEIKSLRSRDVGPGGLFVYSSCSPPIGADVRVEFDAASGHHFQLPATVVRTEPPTARLGRGGFAVAFAVTREVRESIAAALLGP